MGAFDDLPSVSEAQAAAAASKQVAAQRAAAANRAADQLETRVAAMFRELAQKLQGVPQTHVRRKLFGTQPDGWYLFSLMHVAPLGLSYCVLGTDGGTRMQPNPDDALSPCDAVSAASAMWNWGHQSEDDPYHKRLTAMVHDPSRHEEYIGLIGESMRSWYLGCAAGEQAPSYTFVPPNWRG